MCFRSSVPFLFNLSLLKVEQYILLTSNYKVKSSEQEQFICIVYDKTIWYAAGYLSWAVNAAYPTANQFLPEPSKRYKKTFL